MTKLLPRWMWWKKGICTVEIISIGHYPNTVMVELPSGLRTEIEIIELEDNDGINAREKSKAIGNENP